MYHKTLILVRSALKGGTMLALVSLSALWGTAFAAQPPDTTQPATAIPSTNQRSYIKFQVTETVKLDVAGTLEVKGQDYAASHPVAAKAGQQIKEYLMVPASMGQYELTLKNGDKTVLQVTGDIAQVSDGVYKHQLVKATVDPDTLVLEPKDEAVNVAIGSVEGYLGADVTLDSPLAGTLTIGLDRNADGTIDDTEKVSVAAEGKLQVTARLPQSSLPLVSKYDVQFVGPDGTILASSTGDYDFLSKETIASKKDVSAPAVQELSVLFVRKPVATSVTILNASLYKPPEIVKVEPQKEEATRDIIRKGDGPVVKLPNQDAPAVPGPVHGDLAPVPQQNLLAKLADVWWVILLGGGGLFGLFLLVRNLLAGQRVGRTT